MGKPKDTVEIRVFVTPEQRNKFKSLAAAKGLTISEYFLQLAGELPEKETQAA
ncbi:hypothetical protein H6G64_35335 [Calothrix sp. FACHB-156]|nr:hypothetical protein [Calothrix sp. FACHB-156]